MLQDKFNPEIILTDDDLMVISKPAGMVVNNAASAPGLTVQEWFKKQLGDSHFQAVLSPDSQSDWMSMLPDDFSEEYGSATDIFQQRTGIVHRLDKDTSGALVLAKNPGSLINLMAQFKNRETSKQYQCLVHGKMTSAEDTILLPINRSTNNRLKFDVDAGGRPAETHYKVEQVFDFDLQKFTLRLAEQGLKIAHAEQKLRTYEEGFSLLSCWPKTGRTHQIRVHLTYLNHPLVGDSKYLGKKRSKLDLAWCPRQFLHASQLEFTHPRRQEKVQVEAGLSEDLADVLQLLK